MFQNFGCRTLGLVRSEPTDPCPHIDEYFTFEDLPVLLGKCDYICNVLPQTPQTIDILGGRALEVCRGKLCVLPYEKIMQGCVIV